MKQAVVNDVGRAHITRDFIAVTPRRVALTCVQRVHTQNTASAPSHPIQHPTVAESTHMTPVGLVMDGCWQINFILTNIGRRNSIGILNQYSFFWNIFMGVSDLLAHADNIRMLGKVITSIISVGWNYLSIPKLHHVYHSRNDFMTCVSAYSHWGMIAMIPNYENGKYWIIEWQPLLHMAIKERNKYRSKRDSREVSMNWKRVIIISVDFSFSDNFLMYVGNTCHLSEQWVSRYITSLSQLHRKYAIIYCSTYIQ